MMHFTLLGQAVIELIQTGDMYLNVQDSDTNPGAAPNLLANLTQSIIFDQSTAKF